MSGALHLIPVGLGEAPVSRWLPADVRALASRLTIYIAENAKTARAFLKLVGTERPLQEITIHTLSDKVDARQLEAWLEPLSQGQDIGLVSEAGCPAVADPGAKVVAAAHRLGLPVRPWVGPSSILLGLMASGLDGQRFAFHGYAPVDPGERAKQLRAWEQHSARHDQTQMLIETPYRNGAMFATLLAALRPDTRVCVARALTTDQEWVMTRTVAQWKQSPAPELDKQPTLFLFLAARAK
ncbi:SAM-dependent methyltransferase [Bordetella genomosp. 1]|uniref:SAM-dependent methyltransferase n=1 Tax=Bordetella genomosp. 1 TaxID=1395607 RepID=A0A261SQI6_9BORD|nr:SAM-dependent methyltransferase [Bordetella genomosp. 1]MDQ8031861.1 SAM-dependent methyltransferase [Bordetella sp.]OZI39242.1 SAM-dependent methyltransferase [Bordetella genomosp. 1]OZI65460.1 SAM-dependent methyltransferase [Bordetella genomosp. 1]